MDYRKYASLPYRKIPNRSVLVSMFKGLSSAVKLISEHKLILLITILTGVAFTSQAQFNSIGGRFQVDQIKGCVPLTVTITINAPSVCDAGNSCDMFFGDSNTPQNLTFTHTYTQSGVFSLEIVFQTSGTDEIEIEVLPNTPPQFDLYTCGNNEISVNITDTNFQEYIINFNDGSSEITWATGDPRPEHTYASPGNKTVSVRGRNAGAIDNCSANTQSIVAMATLPTPLITQLQVIDNTSIQLTYANHPNILYRLEVATNGSSSFQLLKTSYNLTSETISNLRPDENFYCFRLVAFDPCNNVSIYSPTICSINFDLEVQNNRNNTMWSTNTIGVVNFRLTKSVAGNSFTTTVTGSGFSDEDINCGSEYCYQLVANYPNNSQSIALQKCGTAISTDVPTLVENITLAVQQGGLDVQWQTPDGFTQAEATVFRSDGSFFNPLMTTPSTQITDSEYTVEHPGCYKVSYVDVCGNKSLMSSEACAIKLTGNLLKDNTINLEWSAYSGWRNGVDHYIVEKYAAEGGQLLQTFNAGSNLTFVDDTDDLTHQSYIYVIRAVAVEGGLPQAASNTIFIIKNPNLFYPTAFTPNGDNLNDIFNVYGQYIATFEMNIFNRWGELMYTTTELDKGWDGYFKGNLMPEGTYTFVADITDSAGRTFKKSGSVLLLRKK